MTSDHFIGRYKVIEELGRGGMGTVYHAVDPLLERDVAIKVLHPQKLVKKAALDRFLREARIAAKLDNPYIIKVYDIGSENNLYHIVMEFVRGETLRDIISARESVNDIDIDLMVQYFWQICRALDYAHEMKIIHRDIKPENILVTDVGRIKVMDLGLAVLEDANPLTSTGDVLGTFSYFSPEQARGERADPRSDIYSLGIVFFEMLTNEPPFKAQSPSEMIQKHLYMNPPSILELNDRVPMLLDEIVQRALKKDAHTRYQSVRLILDDLGRYGVDFSTGIHDLESPHVESPPPQVEREPDVVTAGEDAATRIKAGPAMQDIPPSATQIMYGASPGVTQIIPDAPPAPGAPPAPTQIISGAPPAPTQIIPGSPSTATKMAPSEPMTPIYSMTPVIQPPGTEKFVGLAGDLYTRFRKQQREKWQKVIVIACAVVALLIFDVLMARFFRVNMIKAAYWSEDGRDVVFTKSLGSALDFATDLYYPQIGGDELWVYHLTSGKKERLIDREYNGSLAPYPSNIEGNYIWMVRRGRNSQVVVFPLQDRTTVLSWKFEGPSTDLMIARGKKSLVCRERGDVGLMEMGEDPVYVFHARGPYTLRGTGLAGLTNLGARAVFAEQTPKGTNIYVWDKQYRNAFRIATSSMYLAYLTFDSLGKYPTYVLKYKGNLRDYELWMADTTAGDLKELYKSKDGFRAVQWNPQASLLAFATTSKLLFFVPGEKKPRASYDALGIRTLAFTPDSRYLLYAIGTQLYAITLATGKVSLLPVEVPPHAAFSFSPDGRYLMLRTTLATGGARFGIYLYDYANNRLKKIEGTSPSHWLASFFGYRLYVAARNFVAGRSARQPEETLGL
jgi:serine/threonine protein kinase/Tol biopolymer transport system component